MFKLLLSWDIKPGRDQEYFEFIVREFAPGITRLGLKPTEPWFAFGDCPQSHGRDHGRSDTSALLASETWRYCTRSR